jgi:hypothetical protein
MQNLGELTRVKARRPYWLLLALALFFAGQVATASHWHNDAAKLDADCALCVLSSAAGAAIVPDALIVAGVAVSTFIFIEITCAFIYRRVYAYDSRAPPFHS